MKELTFVSGNVHKAQYLKLWLSVPIAYQSFELPEIQSLDLKQVVTHKASYAYRKCKCPVLVEDVSLSFLSLGKLPGTLVKWFVHELGLAGMCRLLDNFEGRRATAEILYALCDGQDLHYFKGVTQGSIAMHPQGTSGFGWNPIFIPEGLTKTFAELSDTQLKQYSPRAKAIVKLNKFLS